MTNFSSELKQLKSLNGLFPTSKLQVSEGIKETIRNYANGNFIEINDEQFFCVGNLQKQGQPFGGGSLGMNSSYSLVGNEDEKTKFRLIIDLRNKIDEVQQYYQFFSIIESMYFLELALTNSGTNYDEDVDVRLFVEKGSVYKPEQLPVAGEKIIEAAIKVLH